MKINTYRQLFSCMEPRLTSIIEKGFKELLEKKHLYQNLNIEIPPLDEFIEIIKPKLLQITKNLEDFNDYYEPVYSSIDQLEWRVKNPRERSSVEERRPRSSATDNMIAPIIFTPPTVKLYCGFCKRSEAYNFKQGQDLLKGFRGSDIITQPVYDQVYSLEYLCQACKIAPEFFLVRRKNNKLTQSGRTPIEQIEIPSFLPKKQRKYFSDSIIASNSGQILAGNFLLRTYIEQYVRSKSNDPNNQNIEVLFSEYKSQFPDDFKTRFPSLGAIYDKLSEDIHTATASEDVFNQSKNKIEEHFDAKRLYKKSSEF